MVTAIFHEHWVTRKEDPGLNGSLFKFETVGNDDREFSYECTVHDFCSALYYKGV
jgi:hypothetical protein